MKFLTKEKIITNYLPTTHNNQQALTCAQVTLAKTPPVVQAFAQPSLQLDLGQARLFLKLLGKEPEQTWIRCLKPWLAAPGTGADREQLALVPDANAYFITGNGDPANGITVKDSDIKSCPALFVEWDDKPVAWQLVAWQEFGLPEPTVSVSTGGKSIHHYWVLDEPMAPDLWRKLITRLIDHCGADKNNKNPSRLMRLPGSIYYDKETGVATDVAQVIWGSDCRYSAAEIEVCLPPVLAKAASSTRQIAAVVSRQSSDGWPPRTFAEIEAAARFIPARIVGAGTYEESRNAICGCSAALEEAGYENPYGGARPLLGELWPDIDKAGQVLDSTTTRNAASFWKIAADHGYDLSRNKQATEKRSNLVHAQPEGFAPTPPPVKAKTLTFEERWELLELHAGELAAGTWPAMKVLASLASKAGLLDIHRMGQRQFEQLIEQVQRQMRAKSEPIQPGGKFTITSTPFAVEGLFRHALNLLVGQSGAGKSRLIAACMAAWLRGDKTWLKRELNGIEAANRHALIIGPDQNLEDWHLTLAPVGLSWLADPNDPTTVQTHDRLTLYGLETGIQLDADGLNIIRRWVDAHPGGMVLIDSLSACLPAGVDEDKSGAAAPIHKLQEALGDAWGVLTHHTRKSAGKEGNLGVGAGRGSGAIDAAVSRVIGLGLTYKMENGVMVAQESDPRRELLSTKRGGKTEHLIISSDASGFWDVHGDAEALKAQERIERTISNLTEPQSDVLSAVEAADGWITTRGIVEALVPGDEYEPKGSKAAATRTVLKRLEVLGLIETKRVATERHYRIKEKQSYQAVNKGELVLTQEFEVTSSLSSPTGITSELLVHQLVHQEPDLVHLVHPLVSLENQAPPSENLVIATGELGELPEENGELPGELVKTTAPQQVNKVNYLDSPACSPTSSPAGITRNQLEQRTQTTINLTGLSDAEMVGSGADVDASGDDPHWLPRAKGAA